MKTKGKLIIIGGGEDKGDDIKKKDHDANVNNYFEGGILKRLVEESAKGEKSRIEILTTATKVPEELGNDYIRAFKLLKAVNTDILNIRSREEAHSQENLDRLKAADVI